MKYSLPSPFEKLLNPFSEAVIHLFDYDIGVFELSLNSKN